MKKIDPVAAILRQNSDSDPARRAMKYAAMRSDPFVFFRGTCHLYYARLPALGDLKRAPSAWACGDLHLENFGSYKGDNRLTYFDVNDFDEATLAPCIWDVIRVVASITLARKTLALRKRQVEKLSAAFISAYGDALAAGKPRWIERETATGIIGGLLLGLTGKRRSQLIRQRTMKKKGALIVRPDGEHALPATAEEKSFVKALLTEFAKANPSGTYGEVIDVARRIAGTGSLGTERYVALTRSKGPKARLRLLDLKCAKPSTSAAQSGLPQPVFSSEAQRAITIQTLYQAAPPAFLSAIETPERSFVLRELQPSADRLDLTRFATDQEGLEEALAMMAHIVAWGQLRMAARFGSAPPADLMEFAAGTAWRTKLLGFASESAERAMEDWKTYAAAYDDGVMGEMPEEKT